MKKNFLIILLISCNSSSSLDKNDKSTVRKYFRLLYENKVDSVKKLFILNTADSLSYDREISLTQTLLLESKLLPTDDNIKLDTINVLNPRSKYYSVNFFKNGNPTDKYLGNIIIGIPHSFPGMIGSVQVMLPSKGSRY
jgi:hypothetical protein